MDSDKLFEYAINRIAELNKTIFSYRILYLTTLGAIFTGISIIASAMSTSKALVAITYSIPFLQIMCLAGIIVICVLAFLDICHQALIENCIDTIVDIEKSADFQNRLTPIFYQKSSHGDRREVTAYRFNFAILLMYVVPLSAIVCFQIIVLSIIIEPRPFTNLGDLAEEICFKAYEYITIQNIFNERFSECYLSIVDFEFSKFTKNTSLASCLFSIWAAMITLIYGLKRVLYHRRRYKNQNVDDYLENYEIQFSKIIKVSFAFFAAAAGAVMFR